METWRTLTFLLLLFTHSDSFSWKDAKNNLNKLNKGIDDMLYKLHHERDLLQNVKKLMGKVTKDEARQRLSWKIIEGAFMLFEDLKFKGEFGKFKSEFRNEDEPSFEFKKPRSAASRKACKTLGVDCDAMTPEELKRVCRRVKSEWHPDRHSEENKEEARLKFYEVQEACDRLQSEGS